LRKSLAIPLFLGPLALALALAWLSWPDAPPKTVAVQAATGSDMTGELAITAPVDIADGPFQDLAGAPMTLAAFKGRIAIVNLWATWCAPCVKEMPSLDALAQALPADRFVVVPISMDRSGTEAVKTFWAKLGLKTLTSYIDPTTKLGFTLKAKGMPTTLILDAQGREIGRVTGGMDWAAPWIVDQIQALDAKSGAAP